jgi:hypothetical protein
LAGSSAFYIVASLGSYSKLDQIEKHEMYWNSSRGDFGLVQMDLPEWAERPMEAGREIGDFAQ